MNSAEGITLPCNDRSELRSVRVDHRVKNQGAVMQGLMPLAESNASDRLFGISGDVLLSFSGMFSQTNMYYMLVLMLFKV